VVQVWLRTGVVKDSCDTGVVTDRCDTGVVTDS